MAAPKTANKTTDLAETETNLPDLSVLREQSRDERMSDLTLREVQSYEDAMRLVTETYGDVLDVGEHLGSGFALLDDKDKLVDVPFVIMQMVFNEGDYGDEGFVTVALVTGEGKRFIINDGSTGIRQQCHELVLSAAKNGKGRRYGGFAVPQGLRYSEYETCVACGKPRKESESECSNEVCKDTSTKRARGKTHYLNTSAAQ